jgi:GTP-binding protein
VALAVNKIDSPKRESLAHEFYSLGFKDLFPISAEHRLGLDELLDFVTRDIKPGEPESGLEAGPTGEQAIRVAIIGRPNVGKSTLLNSFAGAERAIVSPVAGTTRDAVDEMVVHGGRQFVFVDTAGIRRKGKTKLMAEKLSVVMARRHLRMANVALMVLDATEGVLALDATIAGYAQEEGRAIILCVNKWDAAKEKSKRKFAEQIRDELKFLDYAPVAFISAKQGQGMRGLFGLIQKVYESASKRIGTGELNRFVETLGWEYDMKIYYLTQVSVRPPTFLVFTDKAGKLHFSAERYLINRLRERFGFEGTPIVIKTRRR